MFATAPPRFVTASARNAISRWSIATIGVANGTTRKASAGTAADGDYAVVEAGRR
jgi:hypothetical protein